MEEGWTVASASEADGCAEYTGFKWRARNRSVVTPHLPIAARRPSAACPPVEPKPPVLQYKRTSRGDLIHIDTKKLARIDGIGHLVARDRRGQKKGIGWDLVHGCIDDASPLAIRQALADQTPWARLNNLLGNDN
jgi:hypothetical protein